MELRQKLFVKIHRRYTEIAAQLYLLKNRGLNDLILEVNKLSESVGLSNFEYIRLYQMVRYVKPEFALECGTGKSTFIIAHAMCQNGNGKKLVTMEESEEWAKKQRTNLSYFANHKKAKDWFPGEIKDLIELIQSATTIEHHRIWEGSRYNNVGNYPYTFIMVDGPKLTEERFRNMDLIKFLKTSDSPVFAWIDGRWSTVAICRALFGGKVISKLGWTHSEVYGAAREDLSKAKREIEREMFKMVKGI
jgi:hypothetical protein